MVKNYLNAKCPLMFANFNSLSKRLYLSGHFITWHRRGAYEEQCHSNTVAATVKNCFTSHPFTSLNLKVDSKVKLCPLLLLKLFSTCRLSTCHLLPRLPLIHQPRLRDRWGGGARGCEGTPPGFLTLCWGALDWSRLPFFKQLVYSTKILNQRSKSKLKSM